MTPAERAQFKAAKVKELQSFFDNQVWTFEATKEAEPTRTLTSRMLLKWSKNPDGTPHAKARLIVRGFMDPDAWEGTVPTPSPTTTVQIHAAEPGRQHALACLDIGHRHRLPSGEASKSETMGTTPRRMS